jgi:basic membrane protein A and related proteins
MKIERFYRLFVILTLVMAALLTGCQSAPTAPAAAPTQPASAPTQPPAAAKKLKVAFVINGSISDGSFGTQSYQAIQALKNQPFIEKADYLEGITTATDAGKAMRDFATQGYDVVWAQSGVFAAPAMEIAPQFPNTEFVVLTSPPKGQTFSNVWFVLSEYEPAYYTVGALAAKTTKSNVLGFIGGRQNPLYQACAIDYEAGAKSVNPDIKVLVAFTGDFNDPVKAKEAAVSQIQSGADVIAHALSLGSFGLFDAAKSAASKVWVIGKDTDNYPLAPHTVLTSVVVDYQAFMPLLLKKILDGTLTGSLSMSLATKTVYLADYYNQVPADVVAFVDQVKQKAMNGEVKLTTQADIAAAPTATPVK